MEEPDSPTGERGFSQSEDVQQLLVVKEEFPPEQQNWSPGLDHEDQKPPQIKEEEEEADITEFIFSPVPVKREVDEETPQPSVLHLNHTEENDVSVGSPDPGQCLESDPKDKTSDSSETDVSDGNWEESGEPQSGLNSSGINKVPVGGIGGDTRKTLHSCTECGKIFSHRRYLVKHNVIHTGVKPYSCSVCEAAFTWKCTLVQHMRKHTGEKPFSCSICLAVFSLKHSLIEHIKIHTGEKPFRCSVCDQCFTHRKTLNNHKKLHTGERPYTCSVCEATFKWHNTFMEHKRTHTGERPFSCSVCEAAFIRKRDLVRHTRQHK